MANQVEYLRNKAGSNISKIVVNRDLCIGVASCVTVSNVTFKLDGESKAIVIDANTADDQTIINAAQSCPTQAIIIFDKNGRQVFP